MNYFKKEILFCKLIAKSMGMTFRKSLKCGNKYAFRDKETKRVVYISDTVHHAYCSCLLGYVQSYNRENKKFMWLI